MAFEMRLFHKEDEKEDGIDGIGHGRGDGGSSDIIARYQGKAENTGDSQSAKGGEGVHLIASDAGVIMAKDEEDAIEQDPWGEDADDASHLAELWAENEGVNRWGQ